MSIFRSGAYIDTSGVTKASSLELTGAGKRIGSWFAIDENGITQLYSLNPDSGQYRRHTAYCDEYGVTRWRTIGVPSCFRDIAGGIFVPCALGWTWPEVLDVGGNGDVDFRFSCSFSAGLPFPSYCTAFGAGIDATRTVAYGFNPTISAGNLFVYEAPEIGWPVGGGPRLELTVNLVGPDALEVSLIKLDFMECPIVETVPPLNCVSLFAFDHIGLEFRATAPLVVPRAADGAFHIDTAWPANGITAHQTNTVPGVTIQPAAAPSNYNDDPNLTITARGYAFDASTTGCSIGAGCYEEGFPSSLWGTRIF